MMTLNQISSFISKVDWGKKQKPPISHIRNTLDILSELFPGPIGVEIYNALFENGLKLLEKKAGTKKHRR